MIIDVNAGLGEWAFKHLPAAHPDKLLKSMDKNGIAKAVVTSVRGILYKNCGMANKLLSEEIKGSEGRLIPGAVINPNYPDWEYDLRTAMEDYKAVCVRLYPEYHGYKLQCKCADNLLKELKQFSFPVILPVRVDDERHHHPLNKVPPLDPAEIAKTTSKYPEQNFLITCGKHPEFEEIWDQAAGKDNLFFDVSYINFPQDVLPDMIKSFGQEKILFGTWAPFLYQKSSVLKVKHADISEGVKESIFYKNAEALFNI